MFVPIIQKIAPPREVFIERALSVPGTLKVKKGDKVKPFDVLGETKKSAGEKEVFLGRLTPFLRVAEGEKVERGDVLAERSILWGLKTWGIEAPFGGEVLRIDQDRGSLFLSLPYERERLVAGVGGEVHDLIKDRAVLIKTKASLVRGVFGLGKDRGGEIKVIAKPSEVVEPKHLDASCEEKILVGGASLTPDALKKAQVLKVRGIVVGGIHLSLLEAFLGKGVLAKTVEEKLDLGLTLLVSEGFGKIPMSAPVFEFLKKSEMQNGWLLGERRELIVPEGSRNDTELDTEVHGIFRELIRGQRVQIFSWPYFGRIGEVVEIPKKAVKIDSGIETEVVKVKLEEEIVTVPVRNVGIVE